MHMQAVTQTMYDEDSVVTSRCVTPNLQVCLKAPCRHCAGLQHLSCMLCCHTQGPYWQTVLACNTSLRACLPSNKHIPYCAACITWPAGICAGMQRTPCMHNRLERMASTPGACTFTKQQQHSTHSRTTPAEHQPVLYASTTEWRRVLQCMPILLVPQAIPRLHTAVRGPCKNAHARMVLRRQRGHRHLSERANCCWLKASESASATATGLNAWQHERSLPVQQACKGGSCLVGLLRNLLRHSQHMPRQHA